MNKKLLKKGTLICTVFICLLNKAQTNPNLEFAKVSGDGNPTGYGPVTTTAITFVKNENNPVGTTFSNYTPTLKASFSITNQQYNSALVFGYNTDFTSIPVFPTMNIIGNPANNNFTSAGSVAGQGIQITKNCAVSIFYNTGALVGKNTNSAYNMANLVITFNRPVDNPVLHVGAMGAFQDQLGIAGGFELLSSNVPVKFLKLSANSKSFEVTSSSIKNISPDPFESGPNSASGSVQVLGKGIKTLVFKMSVRGNGKSTNWKSGSGDLVTMGISVLESDLTIDHSVDNLNPVIGDNITFKIKVKNYGSSNNSDISVDSILPNGYLFVNSLASNGNYDNLTGKWVIGELKDGAEEILEIHAIIKSAGVYNVNSKVEGLLPDPNWENNLASVSPSINQKNGVCYRDANTDANVVESKFGITLLKRAGKDSNWPMMRSSGHLVLESNTKGLVITRINTDEINKIKVPIEGMMIYDNTEKCLKIFADEIWSCFSSPSCL